MSPRVRVRVESARTIATGGRSRKGVDRGLDELERQELVEDLLAALTRQGAADGSRLLDLVRCERNLMDALATIRREIEAIVSSARAPVDDRET